MNESISRIYSQVYKNIVSLRRQSFRMADVFIWPILYLFTLTFFVTYIGSDKSYLNLIILGMMGWRTIYFLNLEIVSTFMEEFWSKALPHMMISPISRIEFTIGSAISGLIKAIFVIILYLIITNILYGFWIPDWGTFILALGFLAVIGFSLGLFTLGLAYFFKHDAFNISFIIPDVIVLISGVYFSVESVYPSSILPFIRLLPTTQAFELLKSIIGFGQPNMILLILLTALWLVLAYLFNGWMYNRAKKEGKLARLG
ncbi:Uncharacterised protein [Candidatus Bilamarchaeum dharawalense]|uniref:ABC-2 type transporter n=1 Tax=Candidatus Bilamarchaeum dharawalense TaxID=2885759 RepID=A0A5E4LQJ2_9ARCH|nr:Uncharacterised protein [Candidatus Bilamarchaeum dharawalense]